MPMYFHFWISSHTSFRWISILLGAAMPIFTWSPLIWSDGDFNVFADLDGFAFFSRQYEHLVTPLHFPKERMLCFVVFVHLR